MTSVPKADCRTCRRTFSRSKWLAMTLNLNARNAQRNVVLARLCWPAESGLNALLLTELLRGEPHVWDVFWLWAMKVRNISNQAEETEKGQQPSNDASLPKYSHGYNEGCGARLMCLIKWTNMVSRGQQPEKKQQQTAGILLCHIHVARSSYTEGKKEEGWIHWITEVWHRSGSKKNTMIHGRQSFYIIKTQGENLATACRCEFWWGACAGRQVLSATVWGRLPIMKTITQLTF